MITITITWTLDELEILCKHYSYMAAAHLQKMLPRHTIRAIYRKAHELGLRAYSKSTDYLEYFRSNLGNKSYEQMAAELGCSKQTIAYRIRTLRCMI